MLLCHFGVTLQILTPACVSFILWMGGKRTEGGEGIFVDSGSTSILSSKL
jgi:hypothetical protein